MPESGERRTLYDPYCREHGHSPYRYREGVAPTSVLDPNRDGPSIDDLELRPEPEEPSYTRSWVDWGLRYEITEVA